MDHLDYMYLAGLASLESVCKRAQVGAVIVGSFGHVSGYNQNGGACCEGSDGNTLATVLHAEADALQQAKQFGFDTAGAVLYVTRQPCISCAQLITQAGIKSVYYRDISSKSAGVMWLLEHGVTVDSRWRHGQAQDRYWALQDSIDAHRHTKGKANADSSA